jgi:hypothetical protein
VKWGLSLESIDYDCRNGSDKIDELEETSNR